MKRKVKRSPAIRPSLDRDVKKLERALGHRVSIENPEWFKLMQSGVLVRLHIRRWRAQSKITLADLGLPEPKNEAEREVLNDLMTLGTKRLFPHRYVTEWSAIDSGARKLVTKYSLKTYWGEFVPVGAFKECVAKLGEFETRYLACAQVFKTPEYDAIIRSLIEGYRTAGKFAYKRLSRLASKSIEVNGNRIGEDEFVAAYISKIRKLIPSREEGFKSFAFDVAYSYIPLPSMLASEHAKAERIARMNEREREHAERTARLEREHERVEQDGIRQRERMLRQMNEQVVSEAREQQERLIAGFLKDVSAQTLGILYAGFSSAIESTTRNDGMFVGRAAAQIRNTIKMYRDKCLLENGDIESQLNRIHAIMSAKPKDRKPDDLKRLLRQVIQSTSAEIRKIGENPDQIARANLSADDDSAIPITRPPSTRRLIDDESDDE